MLVQNGGIFDERKGISCMIVNNKQGRKLLDQFGSGIERRESSFENAAKYNGQLTHPSVLKPERTIVLQKYAKGYETLERWYRKKMIPIKIERTIRAAIPRDVKDFVKSVLQH